MSWRDEPPTLAQIALLEGWGIQVDSTFNKGDASDLITQELNERKSKYSEYETDRDYGDEDYTELDDVRWDRD